MKWNILTILEFWFYTYRAGIVFSKDTQLVDKKLPFMRSDKSDPNNNPEQGHYFCHESGGWKDDEYH